MRKNDKNKIKDLTALELAKEASLIRAELFQNKFAAASTVKKNVHLKRNLRKKLACYLTFLSNKETNGR